MCRIAGIIDDSLHIDEIKRLVETMCTLQKHGGPDDEGIYVDESSHLVLGNRRLSLLDLTRAGHMPMQYKDRYWITYNGEIYNYPELKQALAALGHQFLSNTDTEVILAAFSQWGVQAFARLKGMFAFALWDEQLKELYLVRDPAGIKPLYYYSGTSALHFASEIRAFKPLPEYANQNPDWPVLLMAFGHIPEPVTTLRDVKPLPKGCFLKYNSLKKRLTLQSFRHYSYSDKIKTESEATAAIRESLQGAVKRHLLADAPIGVFLSGGVDSGIITMIAGDTGKEQLNSLSIYFKDPSFSEKKYQDILVQRVGCSSRQYLLEAEEFHEALPRVLNDMDMPCCDGINTWFISRYARQQGLKAVLSGIGGDELLGGYPSFKRMEIANLVQRFPNRLINAGRRSKVKQLSRLSYLTIGGIKGAYLFLRGYFTPHEIARQLDTTEQHVWDVLNNAPVFQDISNLHARDQASWMEMNLYMQNQLLRDADVMGMANGVEIRVPFLDDDFLATCLAVTPSVKYNGEGPKPLLIKAFNHELPQSIWKRPKMGFSFPFNEWLGKSAHVKDMLEDQRSTTLQNFSRFKAGDMHWSQLMALVLIKSRGYA